MTSSPPEKRPSPDALLRQARREERGQLKIFLGAAPGVGKTFAMLTEGTALLREGVDIVVAVVETHGRAETEALLEPFERSEEHTSELQSLMRISYAVFCLKKKNPTSSTT